MRRLFAVALSGIVLGIALAQLPSGWLAGSSANAQAGKPALFVNMTTGDSWRGWMGLHFAHNTMKMGHQVTIFLNLDAVKLAAKTGEQEKRPSMKRIPRDIVADFIKDGGKVLICGPCLIFAENAKTLTW